MRIVLCYPVQEHHVEQIRAAAPGAEVVDAGQERIGREILDADIFCGHAKVPMPWDEVVRQGRLRWIQSSAAGLDHCLVPAVVDSPITVTSASGVLANQVAEHTTALLTGLTRQMPVFFRAQQKKEYIRRPTRDLHRATVGILGFGGVGRRVAEVLRPFETTIYAVDLFPVDPTPSVDYLWPVERFEEMLGLVDVLILCLPLTPVTRGSITAKTFAAMKPGSIFVNVARGALVDEAALLAALQSGHLWGAAMDVAAEEPLPESSPLWEVPNLIITPHVGGQSRWRIDDMTDFFCENLRRDREGEPLNNLVDKQLGFPVRKGKLAPSGRLN